MDLKDINSVHDLLEANKEPAVTEKIDELINQAVKAEGLSAAMTVAVNILMKLENIHDEVVVDALKENEQEDALAWAHDSSKLNTAIQILKTIAL